MIFKRTPQIVVKIECSSGGIQIVSEHEIKKCVLIALEEFQNQRTELSKRDIKK